MTSRKTPRCQVCKKQLTDPKSIAKGFGPECEQTFAWMLCDAGLTVEKLGISEAVAATPAISLQLQRAEKALLAGNKAHVEIFKASALRAAERMAA